MKEDTQNFIIQILVIVAIAGFVFMLFGGLGYIMYNAETETQQMYNRCIDTCERVFQEQKLIDCIGTCGMQINKNQSSMGGR